MPAPATVYDIGYTVEQDLANGMVTITDTTDWVAAGIALADVEIAWGFTGPDGMVYRTPVLGAPGNIHPAVSRSATAPIPTTGSLVVMQGAYVFAVITEISPPSPFDGIYEPDDTTHTLDCTDLPDFALTPDINCNAAWVTVNDQTQWEAQGWTINSRELTLNYPLPSQHAPITASGATVTTAGESIYRGTWTVEAEWNVTKDNLTVEISGYKAFDVECSAESCKRWCQIRAIFARMVTARNNGWKEEAAELEQTAKDLVWLSTMIDYSQSCGSSAYTSELSRQFTFLVGDCDCGCDSEPDLITPIFGSSGSTMWLPVQGTGITIIAGSGTYTFSVAQATLDLINSLYNSRVISSDGSITVVHTSSGIAHTYDVSVTDQMPDYMEFRWVISNTTGAIAALGTPTLVGSTFQIPGTITPSGNLYIFTNLMAGSAVAFNVVASLDSFVLRAPYSSTHRDHPMIQPDIVSQTTTQFTLAIKADDPVFGTDHGAAHLIEWFDRHLASFTILFKLTKRA